MARRGKKPDTEEAAQQEGAADEGSTGATTGDDAQQPTEEPAKGDDSEGERVAESEVAPVMMPRVSPEPEAVTTGAPSGSGGGFLARVARWLWTDLEGC